jgi:NAD(P)-dependent dehydrogenase (short-subunit alcohol dehydrogenase family)
MTDVSGKRVVVVGGAGGIGAACTDWLLTAGARVCVIDRSLGPASSGFEASAEADVTDGVAIDEAIRRCTDVMGGLDGAVNAAGVAGATRPLATYDPEEWSRVLGVNLTGTFHCLRSQLSIMVAAGGGSIVNITSVLAMAGQAGAAAYVASKHGVAGLTATAALDHAADGLRVNAVAPGFVDTPMLRAQRDEAARRALGVRHPMGRLVAGVEVAAAVGFLLSDDSSFVTGETLHVDGGLSAVLGGSSQVEPGE